ncbi:hypothetical protein BHE74_00034044 [Ensete ventricosum]|nr:hypothetical protein GW17_00009929 [Ensete ventricosum]RWW59036.1 hypothetical protein BHE74_00034044 [Ensete ventricosum]RZR83212.1 hypothetical protein BHM03_00009781 [Ensete ventricosum]
MLITYGNPFEEVEEGCRLRERRGREMDKEVMERYLLSVFWESDGDEVAALVDGPALAWKCGSRSRSAAVGCNKKRLLSKQLSMKETKREVKWERRRRQILQSRHMTTERGGKEEEEEDEAGDGGERRATKRVRNLTDEDLDELRGCIELGFGFNEEEGGHDLRDTLPALDLYFAVNRQLSDIKIPLSPSPVASPTASSTPSTLCGSQSPRSPDEHSGGPSESWKICNPGTVIHPFYTQVFDEKACWGY